MAVVKFYFEMNSYSQKCKTCFAAWLSLPNDAGPEIDPFWYVGRGVRPIGRFGKRHISADQLGRGGMQPVVRTLELLLSSLKNKESLGKELDREDSGWFP